MSTLVHTVIAVDGTAASGKSTFSRLLASRLGYAYVNTGLMYRGVTWYLLDKGISMDDPGAIAREVEKAGVRTTLEKGEAQFYIGGLNPEAYVREARVNQAVSPVAAVAAVRLLLVAQQQELALQAPLVMEGRDIGTVVFPSTPYKFFIDADENVRAQRRQNQGEHDVIQRRDVLDSQRATSPLTRAREAVYLDSGSASVENLVALALKHLAASGLPIPPSS